MIEEGLRRIVREEIRAALAEAGRTPGKALTTAQAAQISGVAPPRVGLDMIHDGELPGWRLHVDRGDWRVNSRDLEVFMAERGRRRRVAARQASKKGPRWRSPGTEREPSSTATAFSRKRSAERRSKGARGRFGQNSDNRPRPMAPGR